MAVLLAVCAALFGIQGLSGDEGDPQAGGGGVGSVAAAVKQPALQTADL